MLKHLVLESASQGARSGRSEVLRSRPEGQGRHFATSNGKVFPHQRKNFRQVGKSLHEEVSGNEEHHLTESLSRFCPLFACP